MTSPSPASVPTEEEISAAIGAGGRPAVERVRALFAPVLAEKERANMRRWTAALSQAQDWRNVAEKAEALAKRIARFLTDEAETQKAAATPKDDDG